jgi:hypothetical protein
LLEDWEPTAVYGDGLIQEWLDNEFSNFGEPCTKYCYQYCLISSVVALTTIQKTCHMGLLLEGTRECLAQMAAPVVIIDKF